MTETPMGPNEIVLAGRLCVLELFMCRILQAQALGKPDPAAWLKSDLALLRQHLKTGIFWLDVPQVEDVKEATGRSLDHIYTQAQVYLDHADMERRSTNQLTGHA